MKQCHGIGRFAARPRRIFANITNKQTRLSRRCREPVEQCQVPFDKTALEQQVARRIAGCREFRADHHLDTRLDPSTVRRQDFRLVTCEVTNGCVDLSQRDFHRFGVINGVGKMFPLVGRARCGRPSQSRLFCGQTSLVLSRSQTEFGSSPIRSALFPAASCRGFQK